MKRVIGVFLALLLCAAPAAYAQVDRATLSGVVRDASGAVLVNATVTVTNIATNVTTTVKTSGSGTYQVLNRAPGQYLIEAESAGLQRTVQSVVLEVGQRARVDITLGVGSLTEAVTVEGVGRLLNTEQAALGSVIGQSSVAQLPLAIRNWDDLLALVAGVQGDRYTEQAGAGTSAGRTGGVNVHGARSLQNNFLLDGVDNNTISENVQELSTQISRPSIDAIQEFKIVTSPYSAEYGRAPGGAISVTTKSGTNAFHGTVYDYYRNDGLDKIDFFSKRANLPKLANDQNQYGANLGGPIMKDKAFFFVDYEATRITRGVTRATVVPTLANRQGVFTSAIRDPLTGLPFANNTIPSNRIDPVAAALLALVPAPNQPGATNFIRQAELADDSDRILGRLDLKASSQDSIFLRFIYSDRKRFVPGWFGGIVDGLGSSSGGSQKIKSKGIVAGWTRSFGSAFVNEFRFSWASSRADGTQEPFGQAPPAAAVVPGVPNNAVVAGGVTGVNISGFFGGGAKIGSPNFLPKFQHTDQFEFLNTASWLKGNHQLKAGFDILAPMKNLFLDVPATRGDLNFNTQFTGSSVADFLLGYVQQATLTNVAQVDQRHWAASFFVQDDWKASERLSVNLGLRYDFMTPALEAQNRMANFNPAGAGSLVFAKDGSLLERGLVMPDKNNIGPRIGLVYKLNDKTVLRGGYGLFYNLFDRVGSEDQMALNPPSVVNNVLAVSAAERSNPVFFLRNGFPSNYLDPNAAGLLTRVQLRAVAQDAPNSYMQQVSAGFQRELFGAFTVSLDGVATWGRNLASMVNLNQPLPTGAGGNALGARPYPAFGSFIEWRQQNGSSNYKGADLSVERRFSKGYGFGISYTLSESRDNTSEHLTTQGSNSFPQDGSNLDSWEGPSDYDVRHRLVANFVTELPFGKDKRFAKSGVGAALFGGWTLSSIFTYRTGLPFTVNQGNNNVGTRMTGMPNLVGDPAGAKTVDQWFNAAAFVAVTSGTFGNAGRNILRGPNWKTVDFSLSRRLATGRYGAVLRWDAFNVLNRNNFGLPNRDRASGAIGTITGLAGDPRLMQLSLRLTF